MRSVRLQLLETLIATAVAVGMLLYRGPPPSDDLFHAAYHGDKKQVLRHIRWGSDIDRAYRVEDFHDTTIAITPLWQAWDGSETEMMDLLYAHGAREYGIRWRRNGAWYNLLSGKLEKATKWRFGDALYSDNVMWPREAARSVVLWLSNRHVAILRVEVFLPGAKAGDALGPFGRHLTPKRLHGERWTDFVERVNGGAAEYIQAFAWDEKDDAVRGREPYFAFLLISRMEYESPLPGDLDVE